jgi:hypothetical protein
MYACGRTANKSKYKNTSAFLVKSFDCTRRWQIGAFSLKLVEKWAENRHFGKSFGSVGQKKSNRDFGG